ncbi:MAG: hypothetical protein Q8P30_04380 [Candidatus Uhrbacteria bacterium]|nr:hypothetical protein [Candidatus Uhrbacteria bacterium]
MKSPELEDDESTVVSLSSAEPVVLESKEATAAMEAAEMSIKKEEEPRRTEAALEASEQDARLDIQGNLERLNLSLESIQEIRSGINELLESEEYNNADGFAEKLQALLEQAFDAPIEDIMEVASGASPLIVHARIGAEAVGAVLDSENREEHVKSYFEELIKVASKINPLILHARAARHVSMASLYALAGNQEDAAEHWDEFKGVVYEGIPAARFLLGTDAEKEQAAKEARIAAKMASTIITAASMFSFSMGKEAALTAVQGKEFAESFGGRMGNMESRIQAGEKVNVIDLLNEGIESTMEATGKDRDKLFESIAGGMKSKETLAIIPEDQRATVEALAVVLEEKDSREKMFKAAAETYAKGEQAFT